MPAYLVHGFRWTRPLIRIHIAKYNLEDCAAEWIILPGSDTTLLTCLYQQCPFLPPLEDPTTPVPMPMSPGVPPSPIAPLGSPLVGRGDMGEQEWKTGLGKGMASHGYAPNTVFNEWSPVKFLEQYDSNDESVVSQPYAYVADYVMPVLLSADIGAEMEEYEARKTKLTPETKPETYLSTNGTPRSPKAPADWFPKLRDYLEPDARIGWYVVECDTKDRLGADMLSSQSSRAALRDELVASEPKTPRTPKSAGLRGFFALRERPGTRG